MASILLMLWGAYLIYEYILAISDYMFCIYPCSCNSEHCDFYEVNHYDLITAFENTGAVKC